MVRGTGARTQPSISVVIPTCDRVDFLREAIESVKSQTYLAHELIVVDNGLVASAPHIKSQSNLTFIRTAPKIGGSRARNIGFRGTSGEYVAFLDDDDLFEERYLERIANAINSNNESLDLLVGTLIVADADCGTNRHQTLLSQDRVVAISQSLVSNPGVTGSNIVVRSQFFGNKSPFDETLPGSQDRAFFLDALLAEASYAVVRDAFVYYRRHGGIRITDGLMAFATRRIFVSKYWPLMDFKTRLWSLLLLLRSVLRALFAHAQKRCRLQRTPHT